MVTAHYKEQDHRKCYEERKIYDEMGGAISWEADLLQAKINQEEHEQRVVENEKQCKQLRVSKL